MDKYDPIWDEVEERLLTFHDHCIEQLDSIKARADITWDMVEQTINHPDHFHQSPTGRVEYRKKYDNHTPQWLKVVVEEESNLIITAYWANIKDDE
jgi:hypothetical protein